MEGHFRQGNEGIRAQKRLRPNNAVITNNFMKTLANVIPMKIIVALLPSQTGL